MRAVPSMWHSTIEVSGNYTARDSPQMPVLGVTGKLEIGYTCPRVWIHRHQKLPGTRLDWLPAARAPTA